MVGFAIEMKQIVKRFGTIVASDHVDFAVRSGEIHALLGENGAGKSTIMSMLSGIYRADSGSIAIGGHEVRIRSPKDAMMLGIGMVHQNFRLVPTLTALDNIILGEKGSPWRGSTWTKRKREQIEHIASQYGLRFPVHAPIWQLSVGEQQRVEIVKTLYRGADMIILDEPTSVLTPGEADQLFETMQELKAHGKTMIITTHKLKEVMAVADRISVMRKGKMIAKMNRSETSMKELAELMVGRELKEEVSIRGSEPGKVILDVEGMTVKSEHGYAALKGINFKIREGEIIGIAGVAGNGQKELAEALTGLKAWHSGRMIYLDRELKSPSVRKLIDLGIAHVPEDRMKSGLAGGLGIIDNLLFKTYRKGTRSSYGLLRKQKNKTWSEGLVRRFDIRTPDLISPVRQLSGGNQQKLLLAREIDQQPKLMIAVHPTQGLDIGAADAVHQMLLELRTAGGAVLLISEDLDEILRLSDRTLVLYNGQINGEVQRDEADKERIGRLMAGLQEVEAVV